MSTLSNTARNAIAAYGGADTWHNHKRVRAIVSADGLAFTLKRRPGFRRAIVECDIHRPYCKLTPIGRRSEIAGVLIGQDVQLQDATGAVVEQRKSARTFFPFGRRTLWWDDMDMAWFACYAFWNYFTLPYILMNPDVIWTEVTAGHLKAEFPPHIPTHSAIQHFYFDTTSGLLLRHDYTAAVIAPVAHAANVVVRHSQHNGLFVPSERKVTPVGFGNKPLSGPVLIHLHIHEFALEA